ncbi:Rrf2 family transcriptional regulator, iron-sulfur cluster assembly [Candidatus Kinetoplastibacterium blastocrithidii TCC012E]|uniref:Rrf2 family transcriptional regulator, iron-sulfur cluster assembly n=1 Tax=Candidatus Kinetoplastidibacterium blastocrithidiae TCC012E TaxID=1208922 RepID=M1LVV0_9PROT|nr:Rrf2 family transcriptional regulator [Candidatus Kinetoplastibacterium blastocrithidii]AFZ83563.1 Rrf2 family transcriptional regulator, iron-sulfur cluster assembly transcription factor [Candidatus Kinetoplastibacterium blastocrithidii (ex Strigomonas culicis)]AGF49682.1 Rrf2 family transcriptional regulator, iron-sulfur cluster assembly [Candidatus Kinetoplastibacterium blastocrithidii TCC012E]
MRLTTKGRFAVTAMLDLALNQDAGRVSIVSISKRNNISLYYLEQLFIKLRKCSLVIGMRGPSGGYYLARLPDNITLADIICAVDECIDSTSCGGKINCIKDELTGEYKKCLTHDLWSDLNRKMFDYLNSISLLDLMMIHHKGLNHLGYKEYEISVIKNPRCNLSPV